MLLTPQELTLLLNSWQGERFPFAIIMILVADNWSCTWTQVVADLYTPTTEFYTHEILLLMKRVRYTIMILVRFGKRHKTLNKHFLTLSDYRQHFSSFKKCHISYIYYPGLSQTKVWCQALFSPYILFWIANLVGILLAS